MTIERANEILEAAGIRNTTDSDRGNYLGFQAIRGVTNLCDCNTCTPYDIDDTDEAAIAAEAAAWLDAVEA